MFTVGSGMDGDMESAQEPEQLVPECHGPLEGFAVDVVGRAPARIVGSVLGERRGHV